MLRIAISCLLVLVPGLAAADNYLMFGPSLGSILDDGGGGPMPLRNSHQATERGDDGEVLIDESHIAEDAGHTVTIVDASEWAALTTQQFASYDAIVIGDAACDFDEGDLLQPVEDNKTTWSPAVTGHLFLHTFDNIYHLNFNDPPERGGSNTPEQIANQRDLAEFGMEFAASVPGATGLYYANGCRGFEEEERGTPPPVDLTFLSELVAVSIVTPSGDDVEIIATTHPSMASLSDPGLSDWGSSFHAYFWSFSDTLEVLAVGSDEKGPKPGRGGGGGGDEGFSDEPVILATIQPVGGGVSILQVPTISAAGLAFMASLLLMVGWFAIRQRL